MTSILERMLDIREGEMKRTAIMAGYLFVIIAAHNILKPMSRSLFVVNSGAHELPFLYMLVALVGGVVVLVYLQFSNRLRLDRLINGTSLFLMSNLLFFWFLLLRAVESPSLYYSLFIWSSLFGVLTTTQFWLLANYLFNAREAKRLYPLLTVSAIVGGIAGGYIASFIVEVIGGTHNLALVCIGLLGIAMLLMNAGWQLRQITYDLPTRVSASKESENPFQIVGDVVKLIRGSRHLAFLIGIVACTFICVQIADFQFTVYAAEANPNADDLTRFLGFWVSNLSIVALLFQVFFANAIIKRFGVLATVLFLPLSLLLGSVLIVVSYGLISVLFIKIGDGAFRHSINKVGTELLYLPIPAETKKKTKAFVDLFVEKLSRGFGGALLWLFFTWFGLSIVHISFITIAIVGLWLLFAVVAYREYVNSFRQALDKRRIDVDTLSVSIKDEATINSLILSLGSRNERQVVYALQLLDSVDGVDLSPALQPLLSHPSAEVRLLTLKLLRHQTQPHQVIPNVRLLLRDSDENVRREAVRLYAKYSKASASDIIEEWLRDENSGLRGAALYYMAEKPELAAQLLQPQLVEKFMSGDRESRSHLADALGILRDSNYYPQLQRLLQDDDPTVKLRAIKAAGKTQALGFVPALVQLLGHRDFRKGAREALAAYGEAIIEPLIASLNDPQLSIEIRIIIPRVLHLIPSQRCVEALLENLFEVDERLRYQIIKALNKLRSQHPHLRFDTRVDTALDDELKNYYRLLAAWCATNGGAQKSGVNPSLLQRALQERLDDHLERTFRLLGLRYPPRDIYNAFAAASSGNRVIRANAVEFLDNILASDFKRIFLPVVEELPPLQILQSANGFLDTNISTRQQALERLAEERDPWLRACALYEIWNVGLVDDFRPFIERATSEANPLVQETAYFILKHQA
jgi:AAA family ATP:ADP antiporter